MNIVQKIFRSALIPSAILKTIFFIYWGKSSISIPELPYFISSRLAKLALSKNIDMKHFTWNNSWNNIAYDAITKEIGDLIAEHPSLLSLHLPYNLSNESKNIVKTAIAASKTIISQSVSGIACNMLDKKLVAIIRLKKAWKNRASQPLTYLKILEIEKSLDAIKYISDDYIDTQAARREIADLKHNHLFKHYALSNGSDSAIATSTDKDCQKLIQQTLLELSIDSPIKPLSYTQGVQQGKRYIKEDIKKAAIKLIIPMVTALSAGVSYKLALDSAIKHVALEAAPRFSTALGLGLATCTFKASLNKTDQENISFAVDMPFLLCTVKLLFAATSISR